jgi:hypothetical protein
MGADGGTAGGEGRELMALNGEAMRLILDTRRRLNQMRGPLIEGMDDGNIGGLGQSLTAAWSELRDAFVTVEEVLRAITPQGAPYP